MLTRTVTLLALIGCLLTSTAALLAQPQLTAREVLPGDRPLPPGVAHQYPLPCATEVNPVTEIGIRSNVSFNSNVLKTLTAVAVGSRSGNHELTPRLTRDGAMIILHPNTPFDYNESVAISFTGAIVGDGSLTDNFSFNTMVQAILHLDGPGSEDLGVIQTERSQPLNTETDAISNLEVVTDGASVPGEMSLANFGGVGNAPIPPQLLSLDEHAKVLRSKPESQYHPLFFGKMIGGKYAWWSNIRGVFYVLDSATWNVIDSLQAADGDSTDGHDLLFFANGSYAMIGVQVVTQDMSSRGGKTNAIVGWSTIQLFDKDKNLIWRWSGYDHFAPSDIEYHVAFNPVPATKGIDAQHSNAIDFDSNGDVILSSRHLCQITKIKYPSGQILWHLGGAQNEFTLVGDSVWFSYQHDVRWLPNGHLMLFDNANYDTLKGNSTIYDTSRAVEYVLDTVHKTATLFWQFQHNPYIKSFAMGSAERLLPSGNTLIGWGADASGNVATEVTPNNTVVFELKDTTIDYNYRIQKYPTTGTGVVGAAGFPGVKSGVAESLPLNEMTLSIELTSLYDVARVQYTLPNSTSAGVVLYDAVGREVRSIPSAGQSPGSHSATLNLLGLASGTYYCIVKTPEGIASQMFQITR